MAKDTTKSVADDDAKVEDQFNKTEEEITDDDIRAASGPLALLLIRKNLISRSDVIAAVKEG